MTVMLVPSAARGKPLQFHTTKRMLLTLVGVGAGSFVVAVLALTYIIISVLSRRGDVEVVPQRELAELRTKVAVRDEQYNQLQTAFKAQVKNTEDRIKQVNRLIGKISELTGLPLEMPTTATTVVTSGSVFAVQPGRGGPLVHLPISSPADLLGHGPRGYEVVRDLQQFQLDAIVVRLGRAARHFEQQRELLKTTPLICPVQGEYMFTDRFGNRKHPLYNRQDFHYGLDIAASYQTPIIAPAEGVVTYAAYETSKGRALTIDHGMGLFPRDGVPSKRHFRTRYYHCSKILVKKGAKVKRGDVIALVGSTGTSTGNHVHYEVLVDNRPVDPEFFILNGL